MRNGTDLAPNAGGTEPAPDTGFDQVLWSPIGVCAVIVPVLWWALGTADEASLAVGLLAFGAWVASAPRSATVHPGGPPIPRKADP